MLDLLKLWKLKVRAEIPLQRVKVGRPRVEGVHVLSVATLEYPLQAACKSSNEN